MRFNIISIKSFKRTLFWCFSYTINSKDCIMCIFIYVRAKLSGNIWIIRQNFWLILFKSTLYFYWRFEVEDVYAKLRRKRVPPETFSLKIFLIIFRRVLAMTIRDSWTIKSSRRWFTTVTICNSVFSPLNRLGMLIIIGFEDVIIGCFTKNLSFLILCIQFI